MAIKLDTEQKNIISMYRDYFNNTGGNEIAELIEREGVTYFNNAIVAELQGCCYSQLLLLQRLITEGLLPGVGTDA